MNFDLTSFLAGLIIGWLAEWVIDYFYWRRRGEEPGELADVADRLASAEANAGELRSALAAAEGERDDWRVKFEQLQGELAGLQNVQSALDECRANYANLETAYARLQAEQEAAVQATLDVAGDTRMPFVGIYDAGGGLSPEVDDLTLIKGIGPRFAEKLNLSGILTFAALAGASDDLLDSAIEPQAWQKVDYDSWRDQARTFAEMPPPRAAGDDLQRLEGIGPRYEQLLRSAGILSYDELAAANTEQLAEIIGASPWRNVDYASWIAQARLAAAGDEDGLTALQDQLNRRGGDNLLLIHGLGDASYQALLDAGVTTYAGLAALQPEEIDDMLSSAGLRKMDTAAWIEEAKQRAAGKRVTRVKRAYKEPVFASCPQDLERIFGVGVVYERRLYAAGVGSFWEVAQLSNETLKDILEVEAFQDVDPEAIRRSAMELAVETGSVNRVWDGTPPDDFEPLAGIGTTFERRLYDAGLCTYRDLAKATASELERICRPPSFQKPDFSGWIEAARRLAERLGDDAR